MLLVGMILVFHSDIVFFSVTLFSVALIGADRKGAKIPPLSPMYCPNLLNWDLQNGCFGLKLGSWEHIVAKKYKWSLCIELKRGLKC